MKTKLISDIVVFIFFTLLCALAYSIYDKGLDGLHFFIAIILYSIVIYFAMLRPGVTYEKKWKELSSSKRILIKTSILVLCVLVFLGAKFLFSLIIFE